MVYVNKKNQEGVSYIPNDNDNVIWCKLRKGFFNTQKDIFVGTAYLIPESLEADKPKLSNRKIRRRPIILF